MPVLIDLQCAACGADLPTAPERRIFVCEQCGKSWGPAFAEGWTRLEEIPRQIVAPRQNPPPHGAIVLLPVWVVPVRAGEGVGPSPFLPEEIRLPAVGIDRMQLLMTFALRLTRAAGAWSRLEGAPLRPEPAEITAEDAFELAELVALRSVDGWPPDEELEGLEIPFGPPRLMDLPCHHQGSELRDLVSGRCVSAGLRGDRILQDQREAITSTLLRVGH